MAHSDRSKPAKKVRQRGERRQSFGPAIPKGLKRATGRTTTRETPLHIRGRGSDIDDAFREYIRGRVGFKLGKYALRLNRITVRLENDSGPSGAPAFTCKFKVVLPNVGQIVISATKPRPRAAFDTAADATERAVRRRLGHSGSVSTRGRRAPK